MAEFNHIPIVKEKLREQLKQGLPKAFKIVDKLLPDNSKEHAIILKNALDYDVQNPLQILRNAGIDIEPELEEFRQFLAEISGKKIEPKGSKARKAVEGRVPPEVLSIAKALEFSDFSEKAMKKAEKELLKMIDRFIKEEDVEALFHAVKLLRLVQKGEVEEIKRFGG